MERNQNQNYKKVKSYQRSWSTWILAIWPARLPTAPAAPLTTTVSPSWGIGVTRI